MSESGARAMNTGPREWDAETYDAIADPQFEWGVEVLEGVVLAGDETVLDAGAGSGRVTERLLERLPQGRVIALDGSKDMIEKARERVGALTEQQVGRLVTPTLVKCFLDRALTSAE